MLNFIYFSTKDVKKLQDGLVGRKTNPKTRECDLELKNLYVGVNTWCNLFADITGYNPYILVHRIMSLGIQECIKEADDIATEIRSIAANGGDWHEAFVNTFWEAPLKASTNDNGVDWLMLLSFLKRIKIHTLDHETKMWNDFKANNQRLRYWPLSQPRGSATPKILLSKSEVHNLRDICHDLIRGYRRATELFVLPPGKTVEGCDTYLEKFRYVIENQVWLREHGVNMPVLPLEFGARIGAKALQNPSDECHYQVVPKNYKVGRGIAPEAVSRQVLGYQVAEGLRRCKWVKRHYNPSNQKLNQNMARLGAVNGSLATVDITAASDSISVWLVSELFAKDPDLMEDLWACRSKYIRHGNERIINHMYACMGNATTAFMESIIFLTIAIRAIELSTYELRYGEGAEERLQLDVTGNVRVYNDDVIIPSYAYDAFVDLCKACGFEVNQSKSFAQNHPMTYRESCGIEAWGNKAFHLDLYPRGTSKFDLAQWINLQHTFVKYPFTNMFLCDHIRKVFPEITESNIGSLHTDIWSVSYRRKPVKQSEYVEYTNSIYLGQAEILRYARIGQLWELLPYYRRLRETFRSNAEEADRISKFIISIDRAYNKYRSEIIYANFCLKYDKKFRRSYSVSDVIIPEDYIDSDITLHSTLECIHSATEHEELDRVRPQVEYLAYLMTLGRGIEHINGSPYTKPESMISNRLDFVHKGKLQVTNREYFD